MIEIDACVKAAGHSQFLSVAEVREWIEAHGRFDQPSDQPDSPDEQRGDHLRDPAKGR
jgi:hypothetical protein